MAALNYWTGSQYIPITTSGTPHIEYLKKTGGTTTGNLIIDGVRTGKVYGSNYYGLEGVHSTTGETPSILLGSDGGANLWVISGPGGRIHLRPANYTAKEAYVFSANDTSEGIGPEGVFRMYGEVSSDLSVGHGQFRASHGYWAMIMRFDSGGGLYLLPTPWTTDAPNAGWSDHRPLSHFVSNGNTHLGNHNGLWVAGSNGSVHSSSTYNRTTTGGGNVYINPSSDWYRLARSTSSVINKFAIADLNGNDVPEVPFDRTRQAQRTVEEIPDPQALLDVAVVSYRYDDVSDVRGKRLGYVVENLSETFPYGVEDGRDGPDNVALVSGNLALLKQLDEQISVIEQRITELEAR